MLALWNPTKHVGLVQSGHHLIEIVNFSRHEISEKLLRIKQQPLTHILHGNCYYVSVSWYTSKMACLLSHGINMIMALNNHFYSWEVESDQKYRINAIMKVETDIFVSIAESLIVIVIMYVETFKIEVVVFIGSVIMSLTSYWLITFSINGSMLILKISLNKIKANMYKIQKNTQKPNHLLNCW